MTSLNQNLVMTLGRLHGQLIKKTEQRLSLHGLSFTELKVLKHLAAAPGQSLRRIDLAEQLSLSASGVTRLLLPMEKRHLVEREANPRDARVSLVRLATPGAQCLVDAKVTFALVADELLSPLTEDQVKQMQALAELLLDKA